MQSKTQSPEEFIDNFLQHELPYDSRAAHEYYLQNRELKGRQPAAQTVSTSRRPAAQKGAKARPKGKGVALKGKHVNGAKAISQVRQAAVNGRVASLQARLSELEGVLQDLLDKAKTKEDKKSSDKNSDQTAKQKQAAADSSKDYAEKNKAEIAKKAKEKREENPDANLSIDEVRAKIAKIKSQLKAAIEQGRSKSSNNSKTVKGR